MPFGAADMQIRSPGRDWTGNRCRAPAFHQSPLFWKEVVPSCSHPSPRPCGSPPASPPYGVTAQAATRWRLLPPMKTTAVTAHLLATEPVARPAVRGRRRVPVEGTELSMDLDVFDGPSDVELSAIELEWPLIAAELDIVDAEIRLLTTAHPTELDWRRLRRAERRRLRVLAELLSLTAEHDRRVAA